MSKLTWIEGQNASWENVEMTYDEMIKRFGCLDLIYDNKDDVIGYIDNDNKYIIGNSERDAILNIINNYTYENTSYGYDNALDEAHGFAKENKNLQIIRVSELINDIENFVLISKLPESVKVIDYQEFSDEIDKYFDN